MRDYANKKVIIVGGGLTGLALSRYFQRRGALITLSERREAVRIPGLDAFLALGADLDVGGHSVGLFSRADLVALSPGVPLDVPAIAAARECGVPVLGEIEIAFGELPAPVIAVTGTNGKSTTTSVMGEIFRAWGKTTFVGGNLGIPLIEAAERQDWDYLVAELSSFQLEAIETFRPRYALLLNISEDHLDRYASMEDYIAAKARIFENMKEDDVAVLNAEDEVVRKMAVGTAVEKVWFSTNQSLEEGICLEGSDIVWRRQGREERFDTAELVLKGLHNFENVMAALIPPLLEGCPPGVAWEAACRFTGLPHRMELVRTLDGVDWYNDSKGTNVGSVVKSLAGLPAPVTLIAGGKDKGGDYAPLEEAVRQKVGNLILIGEAAPRIEEALGEFTDTHRAESLEEAVTLARELTPAGGSVLFSPGCSSFDMFINFEARGEAFTEAVCRLQGTAPKGRAQ